MFKKALWNGLANVFAFLLIISIALGVVLEANRGAVDGFFGTVSQDAKFVPDEEENNGTGNEDNTPGEDEDKDELKTIAKYNAFVPADKYLVKSGNEITGGNAKQLVIDAIDIGRKHETEGAVLLKNENNALPLAKGAGTKVTLLGTYAYNTIVNSSMGQKSQGAIVSLRTALGGTKTDFANEKVDNNGIGAAADLNFSELKLNGDGVAAGAGFTVNPNWTSDYSGAGQNKGASHPYTVGEKNPSDLSAAFRGSFASYNDAAIVVLGRGAGESNDYWKGQLATSEQADGITEPLQLTPNERALIKMAKGNFKKVIVLLNCNSAIEIGELKDSQDLSVDAILWIGHPGNYGTLGIADILCGNVSPSGGLYDIYATSNLSTPAMQNMGQYTFQGVDNGRSSKSQYYVAENESIYVGYRYYETRYNDVVYNQGNANVVKEGTHQVSKGTWKYTDEVAYGFGYGLSYTNFKYTLSDVTVAKKGDHEMYATVTVQVQNTGKVAGSTPVQIYGQAPYTTYDKQHLVEKSAIQLLGFEKTSVLAPNATEQFTIKIDMQNFASYDMTYENANNTQGSYILDGGNYYFAIGNGAHDALNNVLALQGKTTANGMDYNGVADAAKLWNYDYNGVDGTTFGVSKTGEQIQNQIPYIDWNYFFDTKQFDHLSRQDWEGTYPEEDIQLTLNQVLNEYLSGEIIVGESTRGDYYKIATDDTSNITWGSTATNLSWLDLGFANWDDARWDTLLNQISLEQATAFASLAGPSFLALDGVNFLAGSGYTDNAGNGIVFQLRAGKDKNMPWVIKDDDVYANWNGQVFGSAPLVASSFNKELMYDIGDFVGTEALFLGLPIVWGPGLNTHRHAYNGRNGEYYSEDPVLSGYCALNFAVAARKRGLIASPKHFVFNDQETQRNGVAPFMTEQRAREIELRAYQIAIEAVDFDGYGMIGLMTSFSKVGPVEVTNSWGMLTGILQQEWGFTGYAVTDISDDKDLYTGMVYAGCTGYDLRFGNPSSTANFASAIGTQANTKVTGRITLSPDMFAKDATMQKILRNSIKRSLWVFAQSNLINRYDPTVVVANIPDTDRPLQAGQKGHYYAIEIETSWRIMYKTLIGISAGLTGVAVALYVVSTILKKENG